MDNSIHSMALMTIYYAVLHLKVELLYCHNVTILTCLLKMEKESLQEFEPNLPDLFLLGWAFPKCHVRVKPPPQFDVSFWKDGHFRQNLLNLFTNNQKVIALLPAVTCFLDCRGYIFSAKFANLCHAHKQVPQNMSNKKKDL